MQNTKQKSGTKQKLTIAAIFGAMGPGLLAALSGNDAGGIATYSSAGASYGYKMLWMLPVMTVLLIVTQETAARCGCVTGKGLASLIRERFGVRKSVLAMAALLIANTAVTISEFAGIASGLALFGVPASISVPLVALLVCLIPTTISGLLAAIGIAGMDRLLQRNVLALSGRAVEAAGDVDVLLLDKTGTITLGNRMASAFLPLPGVNIDEMMQAACLASSGDETPEGRSIVELGNTLGVSLNGVPQDVVSVPFTAETRMSGVDAAGEQLRKGATDSVLQWVHSLGLPERREELKALVDPVAREGGTPLVVASSTRGVLGVIQLKDVVKPGMRDRFDRIRAMGIKTVMITGDNRLTAQAIAAEAGVDDFLAEAKPEDKLQLILDLQKEGRLVAMSGDGTNDAPALAKSDVGLVMNTGTQAAREAGNMIDLDSDPTKLIEIVEIGKQLLITRGALTTFSLANDVAKYFAIIPALFMAALPELGVLNVMHLSTPQSAILSAVIFNALIIILLIPLALKGVRYRPRSTASVLRGNLLVYGLGGVIAPFIGIKLIDIVISAVGLV